MDFHHGPRNVNIVSRPQREVWKRERGRTVFQEAPPCPCL